MKVTINEAIFEQFPDFNAGILAVKGIDNLTKDNDIELFLRHASLEAGLLLKLKPLERDAAVLAYRDALQKIGAGSASSMERTFHDFEAGMEEEKKLAEDPESQMRHAPGSMTGLIGQTALPRVSPVMDLAHGAELQFRMPVLAFDVGKAETPVTLRQAAAGDQFKTENGSEVPEAGEPVIAVGPNVAVRHFFCERGTAGEVTEDTRNLILLIPSFQVNRRKAMSVRNELARRLKDSFGRDVEAAWLDIDTKEFVSQI